MSNQATESYPVATIDTEVPDIPDWVEETPTVCEYCLTMWDNGVTIPEQDIELTRDEFLNLKRRLAELRGYPVPADM